MAINSAIVGAILGAFMAQLLSHLFSKQRDNQKEAREIFQNFIYPYLYEVILYFETETAFRKEHDVERKIDSDALINDISENIKYGNAKLVSAVFKYNSSITFLDGRGYSVDVNRLKVYFWFLDFSLNTIRKIGKFDRKILVKIKETQKEYAVWAILTDIFGFDRANEILIWSWGWKKDYINKFSLVKLKSLLKHEYFHSEVKKFIFVFKYIIESEDGRGIPEHLSEMFNEYLEG